MSHSRTKKFIPSLTRNLTWACHNTQRYWGCEFFGENSVRLFIELKMPSYGCCEWKRVDKAKTLNKS